ncbi:auxin-responsive protein SAUR71 [Punica granatum]|uniref:Auxin-responsive protein SAUR71 n=1 Tax=Punica granatum TaxID=22663 RepID=A0A218XCC2_PUNGR|nr:auxin-responsive protein SAUR71 [Punica granatum]OWM82428.1 hypothetical protein CDL15_Pgr002002 [Punica granatum]
MSVGKSCETKSEGSSVKLRPFIRKLQRGLLLNLSPERSETKQLPALPDDVPEGHFVVLATEGGEAERFVVALGYLTEPAFLRLLEKAKEEYRFEQKGALTVPCRPQELQRILQRRRRKLVTARCACLVMLR